MPEGNVKVGDIVLFRISGEREPLVERPMLVLACGDTWSGLGDQATPRIDGKLFLSWEKDKRSWWVGHCSKFVSDGEAFVADVEAGGGPGQYSSRRDAREEANANHTDATR